MPASYIIDKTLAWVCMAAVICWYCQVKHPPPTGKNCLFRTWVMEGEMEAEQVQQQGDIGTGINEQSINILVPPPPPLMPTQAVDIQSPHIAPLPTRVDRGIEASRTLNSTRRSERGSNDSRSSIRSRMSVTRCPSRNSSDESQYRPHASKSNLGTSTGSKIRRTIGSE
jgi:hypothetical protein